METNVRTNELNYQDEEEFLISVETTLSSIENSICKFVQDIPQTAADSRSANPTTEDENKIQRPIRLLPKPSFAGTDRKDEKAKISTLELQCEELRAQLQRQEIENKQAQEEIERLKNQILNQSTYCASLGAVLGNLAWRASKFPEIVDIWLSGFQYKIEEFLLILNGSFVAFVNTYGEVFPPSTNVEYQFVIGLLGIVTNIVACPEGREFLITNSNGKDFVRNIVKLMPSLLLSQGSVALKRLMLMILYNVSMNKTGLQHLFDSRIGGALNYCLTNNSLPEKMQLLCLRILQSITYDLREPRYIRDLMVSLPIEKIEDLASSRKTEVSSIAKQVIVHLREAEKSLPSI